MYTFNAFQTKYPWITTGKEIGDLSAAAEKAVGVLGTVFEYYPCRVLSVYVDGGCHERETGFEVFASRSYPYRDRKTKKSWGERLAEDFAKEEKELIESTGGWFNTLNISCVVITVLLTGVPGVLQLTRDGELNVLLPWETGKKKERVLAALENAFGPGRAGTYDK